MTISEKILVESLCKTLANADIEVKETDFEVSFHGGRLDCLLSINSPCGRKRLAIELMRQAYPRDIRNAAWQLQSYLKDNDDAKDIIPMVAAEHISEGAKEDLRHHRLAYFEANGTFYLRHMGWLIDIQRASKPVSRSGEVQLFTGAREQVVFTLLEERNIFRSGVELAELSKTSTYTVSTVLAELERKEWIETEGSGRTQRRRLAEPSKLLDAWVDAWPHRRDRKTRWHCFVSAHVSMMDKLASQMNESQLEEGIFTGAAPANRITPFLTRTDTVEIIIPPGEAERYAAAMNLKPADKGANVTLIERSGTSTLFTQQEKPGGAKIANALILYLDLQDGKGRNKELANQLRDQELEM